VKRIWGLGVVLVAIALATAACGSGSSTSVGTNKAKKSVHAAAAAPATVKLADSSLGKILVDANGRTLYQFDHDTPTTSACTGPCASLWPPLMVSGTPHAGPGVKASALGVLTVAGGSQVTYAGHPLYMFANDHAAGDVTGQGFGGFWWVVGADGNKIAPAAAPATTTVPPTAAPQTAAPETTPPATSPPQPQPTAPPATQPPATQPSPPMMNPSPPMMNPYAP
jgi:predicted lipoprotein with Yx(FWY)xxD motif